MALEDFSYRLDIRVVFHDIDYYRVLPHEEMLPVA